MEKQTAVEWLYNQQIEYPLGDWEHFLEQAKEMEKEQMKDAWDDGLFGKTDNFKQYYNETFGE
jgi:hypothetical protein